MKIGSSPVVIMTIESSCLPQKKIKELFYLDGFVYSKAQLIEACIEKLQEIIFPIQDGSDYHQKGVVKELTIDKEESDGIFKFDKDEVVQIYLKYDLHERYREVNVIFDKKTFYSYIPAQNFDVRDYLFSLMELFKIPHYYSFEKMPTDNNDVDTYLAVLSYDTGKL